MSATYTVTGKASHPVDDDPALPASIDLGLTLPYGQIIESVLNFDAPVSDQAVGLGTLATAGAKILFIKCLSGGCSVKTNAGTAIPLAVGGYLHIVNPTSGWLTGLTVTVTGPARIHVMAAA